MNKLVSIEDLYPVFSEKLRSGGSFNLTVTGTSMLPLFRHRLDSIEIFPAPDRLKKNDMPLYRRENGKFVMHRIIGFDDNGDYVLCGDNQYAKEHHVCCDQFIGVVKRFTRKGKTITCDAYVYKIYCMILPAYRFAHQCYRKGRSLLGKAKRVLLREVFGRA